MDLNVAVTPQLLLLQQFVDLKNPFRAADNVNVIEKCKKTLFNPKFRLHSAQNRVLSQRIEHGHQRIALLAGIALKDLMCGAIIVIPQVR